MLKVKFALSSSIATVVDYVLYQLLVRFFLPPIWSNIISASAGMIINFFLQKRYIFQLNRPAKVAFGLSLLVSLIGIGISTGIIHVLTLSLVFNGNQYLIKATATAVVFFYNFYMKRYAFEKRIL